MGEYFNACQTITQQGTYVWHSRTDGNVTLPLSDKPQEICATGDTLKEAQANLEEKLSNVCKRGSQYIKIETCSYARVGSTTIEKVPTLWTSLFGW